MRCALRPVPCALRSVPCALCPVPCAYFTRQPYLSVRMQLVI